MEIDDEVWDARDKYVFRGRDCIGIFDTDNAADAVMAERARVAAAGPALLAAVHRARQYLVLAVHDNEGALRKIAQRDLDMLDAAIIKATSSSSDARR